MTKTLHVDAIKGRMQEKGWTQGQLAQRLGVSAQTVSNWLNQRDFPRPDKLLRLAIALGLTAEKLVVLDALAEPVIAFRKKGSAKTTDAHIAKARAIGYLLKPVVPLLPEVSPLRMSIPSPSCEYDAMRGAVEQTRRTIGIGQQAVLSYGRLIGQFKQNGAVLIPVMWGKQEHHKNAMHIRLPDEEITFVYLNLDVRLEDFKFWMAHELAHVYTPQLAGTDEGEDFADAFAGALLFPHECAEEAYLTCSNKSATEALNTLRVFAEHHEVSLNTVYQQVRKYTAHQGCSQIPIEEKIIHQVRNSTSTPTVSGALFEPLPPEAGEYIANAQSGFQTDFFFALSRLVKEQGVGAGYIQQVLDVSMKDSISIHGILNG